MELTVLIVIYVLAAVFALAGVVKLAGVKMMKDNFIKYGFPEWFRNLIGFGKIVGAIVLLFPSVALLAATGFAIVMFGAAVTHVMSKEARMAVPAVVLAGLSVFVGVERATNFAALVLGA